MHWLENPWTSPSLTHQSHPFVLAPSLFRLPLVYFPSFPPHMVPLVRIYSLHIVWLRLLYTAPGRKSSHAPNLISMGGMFVVGRMDIKHAPNQETVGYNIYILPNKQNHLPIHKAPTVPQYQNQKTKLIQIQTKTNSKTNPVLLLGRTNLRGGVNLK